MEFGMTPDPEQRFFDYFLFYCEKTSLSFSQTDLLRSGRPLQQDYTASTDAAAFRSETLKKTRLRTSEAITCCLSSNGRPFVGRGVCTTNGLGSSVILGRNSQWDGQRRTERGEWHRAAR